MKRKLLGVILTLAVAFLFVQGAYSQGVQFKVPITVSAGTASQVLNIGISGDGPGGTIQDNTIGADTDTSFGLYQELLAPPAPPAPFDFDARIITIPGRTATFPIGLGGGVFGDYRGFTSTSQVDSFKITIAGDFTDNGITTISWPTGLGTYSNSWVIKPQTGADWPSTNMATSTSVQIPAGLQKNIIIIKTGLNLVVPGPTFDLSASSINFGNVPVNGTASQTVTVTNNGTTNALNITAITAPAGFSVLPAAPITIAGGASRVFTVTFAPTAGISYGGNVVFTHNVVGGSPTNLAVSGVGQSQGGSFVFAGASRTRFDNTNNYADSLQLNGYVGRGLKAVQFNMIFKGLMRLRSITRGTNVPPARYGFDYTIARGAISSNGESNDTVKAVIYGLSAADTILGVGGSYGNMMKFNYDVVNTSDSLLWSAIVMRKVFGSLSDGGNAGLNLADSQAVKILNRARNYRGDVNGDDQIDILDLLSVVDHIIERRLLTGGSLTRADVAPWPNGDGVVNVQDLAVLQNMILTGLYPDGTPISGPAAGRPVSGGPKVVASSLSKLPDGIDARVTTYVTPSGIAVRLENAVPVKGIQVEFRGLASAPQTMDITTSLGHGYHNFSDSTLRVLLYNQASYSVVDPGDRLVAVIPFGISNPAGVGIANLVVASSDNRRLNSVGGTTLENAPELPVDFALNQNYPNPFNPSTTISFSVPQLSDVRVAIYNSLGQEVRTLFAGQMDRGTKSLVWEGVDNKGTSVASGMYIVRMTAGSFVSSHKMMLLK